MGFQEHYVIDIKDMVVRKHILSGLQVSDAMYMFLVTFLFNEVAVLSQGGKRLSKKMLEKRWGNLWHNRC